MLPVFLEFRYLMLATGCTKLPKKLPNSNIPALGAIKPAPIFNELFIIADTTEELADKLNADCRESICTAAIFNVMPRVKIGMNTAYGLITPKPIRFSRSASFARNTRVINGVKRTVDQNADEYNVRASDESSAIATAIGKLKEVTIDNKLHNAKTAPCTPNYSGP